MRRSLTAALVLAASLAALAAGTASSEAAPGIRWRSSFPSALKEAKRAKKLVMVDFYTSW